MYFASSDLNQFKLDYFVLIFRIFMYFARLNYVNDLFANLILFLFFSACSIFKLDNFVPIFRIFYYVFPWTRSRLNYVNSQAWFFSFFFAQFLNS